MIGGQEFERRIRMASQLRSLAVQLRAAARRAYDEGRIPYKPGYDIRSDYAYWRKLAEEKGYKFNEAGEIVGRPAGDGAAQ